MYISFPWSATFHPLRLPCCIQDRRSGHAPRHCCKWCNWAHGCNKQEACVTHLFTKFLNQCRRPRLSCFTMFPICRFPRRAFLKSPVFYCDLIRRCLKVCPGCRDARLLTCTGCLAIRACFPLAPPCEAQHALTTGGGDLES